MAQAAQTLAAALPITEEQAMTLVKSGFTNLEGLRDADVEDLVDILGVDEAKAQEIHEAIHQEDRGAAIKWLSLEPLTAMSKIFRKQNANKNDEQNRGAKTGRTQTGQGRRSCKVRRA